MTNWLTNCIIISLITVSWTPTLKTHHSCRGIDMGRKETTSSGLASKTELQIEKSGHQNSNLEKTDFGGSPKYDFLKSLAI